MTGVLFSRRDLVRGIAGLTAAAVGGLAALHDISPTAAVALPRITGVVSSSSGLNVRTGPATSESVLKWLPNGTVLRIRGTGGDWFKVRAADVVGWVDSRLVLLRGTESTVVDRGNPVVKRVALTFDCGSDYGYAGQILSRLAFHGIAASFGLTGAWLTANPDPAVRIAAAGYQMINHTLNHPSYTGASTPGSGPASPAKRLAQIQANENLIVRLTRKQAKPYWRPPYGDIDSGVLRDVGALGYSKTAMWTIDSLGWNGLSADDIHARVVQNMVPGAIVLMHVGAASQDANALDRIILDLKSQDYEFATVADLTP